MLLLSLILENFCNKIKFSLKNDSNKSLKQISKLDLYEKNIKLNSYTTTVAYDFTTRYRGVLLKEDEYYIIHTTCIKTHSMEL